MTFSKPALVVVMVVGLMALLPSPAMSQSPDQPTTLRHDDRITVGVWSADGSRILTASNDDTARVWDSATGAELLRLQHDGPVYGAVWNVAETRILTWSFDGTARIWDAATGDPLASFVHDEAVLNAYFSPDEKRVLATIRHRVTLWEIASQTMLWQSELFGIGNRAYPDARWRSDGERVLAWGEIGSYMLDAGTGEIVAGNFGYGEPIAGAEWDETKQQILMWAINGVAHLWHDTRGETLASFTPPDSDTYDVRYSRYLTTPSPDGRMVATGRADTNMVYIWDRTTGAILHELSHRDTIAALAWNRTGDALLVSLDQDAAINWQITPDEAVMAHYIDLGPDQADEVAGVATWLWDDAHVLGVMVWGTIRVWQLAPERTIDLFSLEVDGFIVGDALSPDGSRLLVWTADGNAYIVDLPR